MRNIKLIKWLPDVFYVDKTIENYQKTFMQ